MLICITPEGIQAIRNVAYSVRQQVESIEKITDSFASYVEEEDLGLFQESLQATINEIQKALTDAIDPANDIANILDYVAQKYEEITMEDPFAGVGN